MPLSRHWKNMRTLFVALMLLPTFVIAQSGRSVTGTYTTTINSPQGVVKAVIVVKREAGAFGGTLAAEGFSVIPVTNVVPSDSGVSLQGDAPDGAVVVKMKFAAGDKVAGTVLYQGQEMAIEGTFASEGAGMAAVLDASGTYELKSTEPMMGMPEFPVTCSLSRAADRSYSGTCSNEQGSAPINSVTVDGNVVTMTGDSPVGAFKAVVTLAGRAVSGTLQLGAELARIKGTFAPK